MKKIIPYLIIGIMVISGLGAVVSSEEYYLNIESESFSLSEPFFKNVDSFISIDLKESASNLMDPGKPMIPVVKKAYTFPVGTRILDVVVDIENRHYLLNKKIQPTPPAIIQNNIVETKSNDCVLDIQLYSNLDLYPSEAYEVTKTIGLREGKLVLSLNVRINSQYSPGLNIINIPKNVKIKIQHIPPKKPLFTADEYDLLIITDEEFVSELQPLVEHKNSFGVKTVIESTQDIYSEYDGRDKQEDIKLRIKDAREEWGIEYVLLAGGRKGQKMGWYVPERLSNNKDDSENCYASDLYYADIYKYDNGDPVFEDWDSNGNGIFAEFAWGSKDIIDYDPDVYVGRIPFRSKNEIKSIIDKIINYEKSADDSWFKHAIVLGGDTGPPARNSHATLGIYEGELSTAITAEVLENNGFVVDKLWLSEGAWSGRNDVVKAINEGAGLIHMSGHGNPAYWGNFLPDAETEDEMVDGLILRDMNKLKNGEKLPIIVVGGCHNAQFNVTMTNFILGILRNGIIDYFRTSDPYGDFWKREWVPRDFCSWLVMKKQNGAIASIGCSGLGLGFFNIVGLSDWLNPRFFDAYANQSKEHLGQAHAQAIQDYITIIGGVNNHQNDRKTVEEFTLIGDPSLRIGGYA